MFTAREDTDVEQGWVGVGEGSATCETVCTVVEGLGASTLGIATAAGRVAVAGTARVLCPVVIKLTD